ncbi:hypothetical protein U9M48_041974 [Paspalum notatum var. saurae]|uniref:Disease resistance R13L4/SHOC-2-like LRR domain-containing protein n=1 Tax=Paspalum notatum var. saurae TaxID=547442 RepID=A0AAQ3URP2_PASNO
MDLGACKHCRETIGLSCLPPGFTQELCQLQNLQTLDLSLDVHPSEFSKDVVSSLSTLGAGSLNSLIIETKNDDSMNLMMEPWSRTPLSLKLLEIQGYCLPKVPAWIGLHDNLQQLNLNVEQLGPEDIDLLGCLNVLSWLFLYVEFEVANRSPSSSKEAKQVTAQGFPSLRKFKVGSDHYYKILLQERPQNYNRNAYNIEPLLLYLGWAPRNAPFLL